MMSPSSFVILSYFLKLRKIEGIIEKFPTIISALSSLFEREQGTEGVDHGGAKA